MPLKRTKNVHFARFGALITGILLVASCGGGTQTSDSSQIVTVYTGRHYGIEPVFEAFTKQTGIEVRFTTGSDPELRERLVAEAANTPADLFMVADAANIELAATSGLLATIDSAVMQESVPVDFRSPKNQWFGLSQRLRVIMTSSERVKEVPTTYAELGNPRWLNRLCLRPSTHPYTQSLVAGMIKHLGSDAALAVVESWVKNKPLYINSDSDILKAIAAGDCDVALANSYYLARLKSEDPMFPVALIWPDQKTTGAHVNVSAAGVTASAPNSAGARQLLEWLVTDGQKAFSDANFEFPVNKSVPPAELLVGFGTFKADREVVRELGKLNADAVSLLSRAGYE